MEKSSLGLPQGSVRAILALGVTGVALTTIIINGEIPQSLAGILGSVLGFYFAKQGDK
jgi:hypothetical protein